MSTCGGSRLTSMPEECSWNISTKFQHASCRHLSWQAGNRNPRATAFPKSTNITTKNWKYAKLSEFNSAHVKTSMLKLLALYINPFAWLFLRTPNIYLVSEFNGCRKLEIAVDHLTDECWARKALGNNITKLIQCKLQMRPKMMSRPLRDLLLNLHYVMPKNSTPKGGVRQRLEEENCNALGHFLETPWPCPSINWTANQCDCEPRPVVRTCLRIMSPSNS